MNELKGIIEQIFIGYTSEQEKISIEAKSEKVDFAICHMEEFRSRVR